MEIDEPTRIKEVESKLDSAKKYNPSWMKSKLQNKELKESEFVLDSGELQEVELITKNQSLLESNTKESQNSKSKVNMIH